MVEIKFNTKCIVCKRKYFYDRNRGHTTTRCNSCMANRHKDFKKLLAVHYKGGKCIKCNYKRCIKALNFHHINPKRKEFIIGGNHGLSWRKLKRELDKCILVCSVCHTEIHAGLVNITKKDRNTKPTKMFKELLLKWKEGIYFDDLTLYQRRLND